MSIKYKIVEFRGQKIISYEKNGIEYSFIEDLSNSDYQRYLRWLEDPNADEFQPPLEG